MKDEKNYLDRFADSLLSNFSEEDQKELSNMAEKLKDSMNVFINEFVKVLGEDTANEVINDEMKKRETCKCDKCEQCRCEHCEDHKVNNDDKAGDAPTKADDLRTYYKQLDQEKKIEDENINEISLYIMNHLEPVELGGYLERCGDVLKMPVFDRCIVATYTTLSTEAKSKLVNKLLNETGFSNISFETVNRTELYVLFRF